MADWFDTTSKENSVPVAFLTAVFHQSQATI